MTSFSQVRTTSFQIKQGYVGNLRWNWDRRNFLNMHTTTTPPRCADRESTTLTALDHIRKLQRTTHQLSFDSQTTTMSSPRSFNETVAFAAAAFAGKLMINKVLIARARIGSSTPHWKEDSAEQMGFIAPVFKVLLAAFGPLTSKDDVARLSGLEANSGECEPALILASPPAYASTLVLACVASRFLHALFFVIVPAQPARAFAFLFPTGVTLFFSAQVISKFRSV